MTFLAGQGTICPPHGDPHGSPQTSPQHADPHGFLAWFSQQQTRGIVKTDKSTRVFVKSGILLNLKVSCGICREQTLLKKSKNPRKSPEKWTFLSLAFDNAPSLHVGRRVAGWSAGRHMDHPCGGQISPWPARNSLNKMWARHSLNAWSILVLFWPSLMDNSGQSDRF